MITVSLIVLIGLIISTQYIANYFDYDPLLGSPLLEILGQKIYSPFAVFSWDYSYSAYSEEVFFKAYFIVAGSVFLSIFVAIIISVIQGKRNQHSITYGSAHFATEEDLNNSDLLNNTGVILGQDKFGRYLRHDGPEHIKVIAPTRSGKGIGVVIPTLLTWKDSVLVYDLKSENFQVTAGYRSKFSKVIYFNPNDPKSARFNPLHEVRLGPLEVKDVQNIADMIVDPEGKGMTDHWAKTGHSLLVGTILHILYAEVDKTLSGVASFLSNPERDIVQTLHLMMKAKHFDGGTHPVVAAAARDMLNKSENERSGVLSTAMSFLSLYRDPIVAANTQLSDFSIIDLLSSDKPISLYLIIPPSDITRLRPLFRLMINQFCRRLTEELLPENSRRRLLLLLDEFPALGKLDFFETTMAFLAGYGIKTMLISQSINQLDKTYGYKNSIIDNSHIRVFFAPNTIETADTISKMLGQKTEFHEQKNYGGHRLSPWLGHVMVSGQETARPLMTPSEVMELPENESIIFIAGKPPIKAYKIKYFNHPTFKERLLKPPALNQKKEIIIKAQVIEKHILEEEPPKQIQETIINSRKETLAI